MSGSKTITAFKGFSSDFSCRGFQYEIGTTHKVDGEIELCRNGFHACEDPFSVWDYYPPVDIDGKINRFAEVQLSGQLDEGSNKIAAAEITVKVELSLPEFIQRGVDAILARIKDTNEESGESSAATNTGESSAATNTGYRSAATNTGYRSAATNTGYRSAATNTGESSAATNTGESSAATNTGYRSAATNTGYSGSSIVSGENSIALASGPYGRAMASKGSAIVICEYNNDMSLKKVHSGIAGKTKGIKPDTLYEVRGGKLVEVK